MANTAAEHEADSGSGAVTNGPSQTDDNSDQNEVDCVTGSNTNYDSSEGSAYKCSRCDFETSNQALLTAHNTQVHNSAELDMEVENNNPPPDRMHRKMFECDVCNMKFSNGANMRRHKMRHTGNILFISSRFSYNHIIIILSAQVFFGCLFLFF